MMLILLFATEVMIVVITMLMMSTMIPMAMISMHEVAIEVTLVMAVMMLVRMEMKIRMMKAKKEVTNLSNESNRQFKVNTLLCCVIT